LNRRKSNISPLVAARIRPARRPPFGGGSQAVAGSLRVVHGDATARPSSAPPPEASLAAELDEARRAEESLHCVDEALGRIHELLTNLGGVLRPVKGPRRRPPLVSTALQQAIDSTLDAIDAIIGAAQERDGRPLLGNELDPDKVPGEGAGSPGPGRGRTKGKRTRTGNPGGFLAALRSGGPKSVGRVEPAEILAILDDSTARIASHRAQIEVFLDERIRPLLGTLEVARENAHANRIALRDPDFAASLGQITGAEALLNLSHIEGLDASAEWETNPLAARFTLHHNNE